MDKDVTKLDAGENKGGEYEVEAICDSAVYATESAGHLLGLYYLVFWKSYPEKENTWEPALAIQHLKKPISLFYKDHPDKPIAIFETIDTALPMAKPTIKLAAKPTIRPMAPKQKQGRLPGNSINKQAKKNWAAFGFYCIFGFF